MATTRASVQCRANIRRTSVPFAVCVQYTVLECSRRRSGRHAVAPVPQHREDDSDALERRLREGRACRRIYALPAAHSHCTQALSRSSCCSRVSSEHLRIALSRNTEYSSSAVLHVLVLLITPMWTRLRNLWPYVCPSTLSHYS